MTQSVSEPKHDTSRVLRTAIGVFVALSAVYLTTASFDLPASIDPQTNALTAYLIAENGSPFAEEWEFTTSDDDRIGEVIWLVPGAQGPVSQYPPGAALHAVPAYWFLDGDLEQQRVELPPQFDGEGPLLLPPMGPAAVTASLLAAGAVAIMTIVVTSVGLEPKHAVGFAVTLGLGTSVWSVASDALWQHGPAIFWIAVAMLAGVRRSAALGAISAAAVVLTRPPAALIVMAIAVGRAIQDRTHRDLIGPSLGLAGGFVGLLLYNDYAFGEPSVSGGYPASFVDNISNPDPASTLSNLFSAFIAVDRGVLVYSPFIFFLILASPRVWRASPVWAKAAAVGGLVYALVQYTANNYQGGLGFGFYRYPLEPLFALTPIGARAASKVLAWRPPIPTLFRLAVGLAVLAHAAASLHF